MVEIENVELENIIAKAGFKKGRIMRTEARIGAINGYQDNLVAWLPFFTGPQFFGYLEAEGSGNLLRYHGIDDHRRSGASLLAAASKSGDAAKLVGRYRESGTESYLEIIGISYRNINWGTP